MHGVVGRMDLLAGVEAQVEVEAGVRGGRVQRRLVGAVVGERHEVHADAATAGRHVGRRLAAVGTTAVHVEVALPRTRPEQVRGHGVDRELVAPGGLSRAVDDHDVLLLAVGREGHPQSAPLPARLQHVPPARVALAEGHVHHRLAVEDRVLEQRPQGDHCRLPGHDDPGVELVRRIPNVHAAPSVACYSAPRATVPERPSSPAAMEPSVIVVR